MKLKTSNIPSDLLDLTKIAIEFYHENFFSEDSKKRVEEIIVRFAGTTDSLEYDIDGSMASCDYEIEDDGSYPVDFTIEVANPYRDIKPLYYLKTLFHEMTHVDQYCSGRLESRQTKKHVPYLLWEGDRYEETHEYWKQPWEIEAYGTEECALLSFLEKHKDYGIKYKPNFLGRKASKWKLPDPETLMLKKKRRKKKEVDNVEGNPIPEGLSPVCAEGTA